ncbi:hypothetical protein FRC03_003648 [Tulasnella sp. 419]|nr:hypothetical protein FRC02_007526 [Tulasnella sp. 418]KAG8962919.1 hypothetical protein FRC03_003648 [Tulasnella sp. 419]
MDKPVVEGVDSECVSLLNTGQIVGLSFIAESGVISTLAVLVFLGLVVRNVISDRRNPGPNGPAPLIRTHIDGYILSLMFADLLQGLGAIFSAKWAAEGKVYCSNYCTAQGAIQQLGETGVAMSTLAITVHTFATVFFRWQPSKKPWLWIAVVSFIWLFLLLFVVLGYVLNRHEERLGGEPYFGPTPFWCWIKEQHMPERIAGEYFWLWFCAILNIILYPFLFFTLRGNIDVDPTNWRRIRFHRRSREDIFGLPVPGRRDSAPDAESTKILKAKNKEAMKMFWYPISYTILVLPLSITRWSTFENSDEPDTVAEINITTTTVVLFIFGCSGLVNVLLFLLTRPNLLLFNRKRHANQLSSNISFAPQKQGPLTRSLRAPSGAPQTNDNWGYDDDYDRAESPYPPYPSYPPPPHTLAPLPPQTHSLDFPNGEKVSSGMDAYTHTTTVFAGGPIHRRSPTNLSNSQTTTKTGMYPLTAVEQYTNEHGPRRQISHQRGSSESSSEPSAAQVKQQYLESLRGGGREDAYQIDGSALGLEGGGKERRILGDEMLRNRRGRHGDEEVEENGWESQMKDISEGGGTPLARESSSSPIIFTSPPPIPPPPAPPTDKRPSTAPETLLPTSLEPAYSRTTNPMAIRTRPHYSPPGRGPHSISTLPTMPPAADGRAKVEEWAVNAEAQMRFRQTSQNS